MSAEITEDSFEDRLASAAFGIGQELLKTQFNGVSAGVAFSVVEALVTEPQGEMTPEQALMVLEDYAGQISKRAAESGDTVVAADFASKQEAYATSIKLLMKKEEENKDNFALAA